MKKKSSRTLISILLIVACVFLAVVSLAGLSGWEVGLEQLGCRDTVKTLGWKEGERHLVECPASKCQTDVYRSRGDASLYASQSSICSVGANERFVTGESRAFTVVVRSWPERARLTRVVTYVGDDEEASEPEGAFRVEALEAGWSRIFGGDLHYLFIILLTVAVNSGALIFLFGLTKRARKQRLLRKTRWAWKHFALDRGLSFRYEDGVATLTGDVKDITLEGRATLSGEGGALSDHIEVTLRSPWNAHGDGASWWVGPASVTARATATATVGLPSRVVKTGDARFDEAYTLIVSEGADAEALRAVGGDVREALTRLGAQGPKLSGALCLDDRHVVFDSLGSPVPASSMSSVVERLEKMVRVLRRSAG